MYIARASCECAKCVCYASEHSKDGPCRCCCPPGACQRHPCTTSGSAVPKQDDLQTKTSSMIVNELHEFICMCDCPCSAPCCMLLASESARLDQHMHCGHTGQRCRHHHLPHEDERCEAQRQQQGADGDKEGRREPIQQDARRNWLLQSNVTLQGRSLAL